MSVERTRVVNLRGQVRDQADNMVTMVVSPDDLAPVPSFRNQFIACYEGLHQTCTSFGRPGVAVVAVDGFRGRVAAGMCLAAKPDRANAAIIGRHGVAELYLDADPNVSLRHMALVLHPLPPGGEIRFHLIDLRSPLAFLDERSRRLEALLAEGPVFIRCGRYLLYFIVTTGEADEWPDDPEDGWACIPERIYFDETDAEPDRHRRQRRGPTPAAAADRDHPPLATRVQTLRGPARAQRTLLGEGEPALGTLELRTPAGGQALVIGARAAREGVLLGRYDRCDGDGATLLDNERISRVHLLVVSVDGALYAIDTASTNGTRLRPTGGGAAREVRIARLDPGFEIMLGEDLAYVSWKPWR